MKESSRCLYNSNFNEFIREDSKTVLGILCDNYHGDAMTTTREAWKDEISIMQETLSQYKNGQIIFEYDIPRLGKRIDVVLLLGGIVFCLEFKVGESKILEADIDQVFDYALDLKNFHKFSRDKIIVPILIATNYQDSSTEIQMSVYDDLVVNPLVCGETGIKKLIDNVLNRYPLETPVNRDWIISPYSPTPTIIEAAKSLYENHSVENITRHEADKVGDFLAENTQRHGRRVYYNLFEKDKSIAVFQQSYHFKRTRQAVSLAEVMEQLSVSYLHRADDKLKQVLRRAGFYGIRNNSAVFVENQ